MRDFTLHTYYRLATATQAVMTNSTHKDYFAGMKAFKTATLAIIRRDDAEWYVMLNQNDYDDLQEGIYLDIETRTIKLEEKWLEKEIILSHEEDIKPKAKKPKTYKPKKYKPKDSYSDCMISDIKRS
jgi:hypothetical protein